MKKQIIIGMAMRPCATDAEQNERIWRNSELWVEKGFYEEYSKHLAALEHITEFAKIFIEKNWQKVTDWSDLEVIVKGVEFFNHKPRVKKRGERKFKFLDIFDEIDAKRHNPVHSVTNVVLDHTDGDFSITINETDFVRIDNKAIIKIADFIETHLNGKDDKDSSEA